MFSNTTCGKMKIENKVMRIIFLIHYTILNVSLGGNFFEQKILKITYFPTIICNEMT